ncbi:agmatine deiminase family protein [Teredinibacter haidensis]|uniref:agmatine deiminase family protein n=1 Tax=Teredinibacter haidensis TaxID=2731755 RepID=UPI000948ABDD|nr:agmatine deiminase family protein [Teredinibacter haidensis]
MRLLPEYTCIKSILLALPYKGSDWDDNLLAALNCYRDMVTAFLQADETIGILLLAKPGSDWRSWYKTLHLSAHQQARLNIIADIDYDDTWVRDYGPLSYLEPNFTISYRAFQFDGWGGKYSADADNAAALQLYRYGVSPQSKVDLVLEGGGVEINDDGILLVNRDCIVDNNRNSGLDEPTMYAKLLQMLGADDIEWVHDVQMTGDDTDGHIDTLARFLDNNTVVCCGRNGLHHDAPALERLNDQLEKICSERHWNIIKLPVPVIRSAVDERILPATYANFLLCHQHIFLPVYGVDQDLDAITILENAAPDKTIVPIRCEALLEQHGSLHCATMQIAGETA